MPDLLDLLTTYGPALRRIALHQEILVQLWRGLPSFRGDAAPGTWLYRVALNTALTWRRRAVRRGRGDSVHSPPIPSAREHRSEAAILDEFLAALGPLDRSVLLLYMEGLSYKDIGEVTGLSAGHVGVRLHRIKQSFTERYVEK